MIWVRNHLTMSWTSKYKEMVTGLIIIKIRFNYLFILLFLAEKPYEYNGLEA